MKTNAGVPTAATGRPIVVDGEEQLRLYDALPERWRNLVDSLPIEQDMRTVTQYLERLGDDRGFRLIVENFRIKFPGWEPEFYRGEVECRSPQSTVLTPSRASRVRRTRRWRNP